MPEESVLRVKLMDAILGPDHYHNRVWLPGSQPVSLDATNKGLLEERQYWCGQGRHGRGLGGWTDAGGLRRGGRAWRQDTGPASHAPCPSPLPRAPCAG